MSLKMVNVSELLVAVAFPTTVPSNVDCAFNSMFQVNVKSDVGKDVPEKKVVRIDSKDSDRTWGGRTGIIACLPFRVTIGVCIHELSGLLVSVVVVGEHVGVIRDTTCRRTPVLCAVHEIEAVYVLHHEK